MRKFDPYKSMGLDRLHLRLLRGLAGVTARLLFIIFERLWNLEEAPPMTGEGQTMFPSSKKKTTTKKKPQTAVPNPTNCRLVIFS